VADSEGRFPLGRACRSEARDGMCRQQAHRETRDGWGAQPPPACARRPVDAAPQVSAGPGARRDLWPAARRDLWPAARRDLWPAARRDLWPAARRDVRPPALFRPPDPDRGPDPRAWLMPAVPQR
jgi:hypothetical protein